MKVDDIQRYLSELARLVQSGDGKKAAAGLSRIAEGLQPFRNYDLEAFAAFLGRAEEYSRTGIVQVIPPKAGSRPKASPQPKNDVSALRAEIMRLYAVAGSPETTIDAIETLRDKLGPLKKGEIAEIAEAIGLVGMSKKTKPDITEAIVARLRSIKQSAIRTSIIDRPGTTY